MNDYRIIFAKLDAAQRVHNISESRQHMQAAAQREQERIQALANADQEDPLLKVNPPNMEWFKDVDKLPLRALLLFAWNTGHAYLPALTNCVLHHSLEWPDIMSEAYSPELELPPELDLKCMLCTQRSWACKLRKKRSTSALPNLLSASS